jgi:hypothetical protein
MSKSDWSGVLFLLLIFIPIVLLAYILTIIGSVLISPITWIIVLILLLPILFYMIFEFFYYQSDRFLAIQNRFEDYVSDCNGLNEHIEDLKRTFANLEKTHYGSANLVDSSRFNFRREHQMNAIKSEFIYECSATICKNAEMQPFKYLCKYFNIKPDENSLNNFEKVLNNFSAAEEGKNLLQEKLNGIKESAKNEIPWLISSFGMKKFMHNLGFWNVDFKTVYYSTYSFRYISPGGNKSSRCDITFDIRNLNEFIKYLSEVVKFSKSVEGQRALMTSSLREYIKKRDNYTCKICSISSRDVAHLLLEIDHIVPVSRGGLTTESNLQTLCWKCNRAKGAKFVTSEIKN